MSNLPNDPTQLVCYDQANYDSYEDAAIHGAVYNTFNTIDALASGTNGVADTLEVVGLVFECLGLDQSVQFGWVKDGEFIDLLEGLIFFRLKEKNYE